MTWYLYLSLSLSRSFFLSFFLSLCMCVFGYILLMQFTTDNTIQPTSNYCTLESLVDGFSDGVHQLALEIILFFRIFQLYIYFNMWNSIQYIQICPPNSSYTNGYIINVYKMVYVYNVQTINKYNHLPIVLFIISTLIYIFIIVIELYCIIFIVQFQSLKTVYVRYWVHQSLNVPVWSSIWVALELKYHTFQCRISHISV